MDALMSCLDMLGEGGWSRGVGVGGGGVVGIQSRVAAGTTDAVCHLQGEPIQRARDAG